MSCARFAGFSGHGNSIYNDDEQLKKDFNNLFSWDIKKIPWTIQNQQNWTTFKKLSSNDFLWQKYVLITDITRTNLGSEQ